MHFITRFVSIVGEQHQSGTVSSSKTAITLVDDVLTMTEEQVQYIFGRGAL